MENALKTTEGMSQQEVTMLVNQLLKMHNLAVQAEHIIRVVPIEPVINEAPLATATDV